MKRYLKLVNFEFNRIAKVYFVLLAIVLVSQFAGVIVESKSYLKEANHMIYEELMPKAEFFLQYGPMSLERVFASIWFFGPIALCIGVVAFYIFLIWYRDWFGKNTFIYRLLMLPTARLNVFLAKLTTILLMTLGFVAFQLILFPIESTILKWMVPKDFRMDMGTLEVIGSFRELQMIIPTSFIEFILYYGAGFAVVTLLFTAIMFERCYRIKGILLGIGYGFLAVVLFFTPILIQEFLQNHYLYPSELLLLEIVMGLIVTCCSIWTSSYLLKKKIRV
ncbi:hypothetical protein [Virgibacillus oceani]|uniref:Uncharacterized protein n=1 Tax=Virgibacillus oceani TaxID=1479511 RepID=A0A917HSL2_9BACI|nr:hypothetical protein [Virgibacillus oceani]GGG88773.1 hypothetical protein GCM10011398_38450 [Virgibacillus oceani]